MSSEDDSSGMSSTKTRQSGINKNSDKAADRSSLNITLQEVWCFRAKKALKLCIYLFEKEKRFIN